MPAFPRKTVLCRYRYDPLDRLADCVPYEEAGIQRFYCKSRLATEIQDAVHLSVFQHDDQLLAQQQSQSGKFDTTLLATDQQRSVLNALDATRPHPLAYTPYGHRPPENGLLSLLGFNGERPDPVTGHYHLGNGYRQFNPVLMRFNSPDSWSPFGEGGLNAYAYCGGDPVNQVDPNGNIFRPVAKAMRAFAEERLAAKLIKKPIINPSRFKVLAPATSVTAKNRANLSSAVKLIKQNEPLAEVNATLKKLGTINDLTESRLTYNWAKREFRFNKIPDIDRRYTWKDIEGVELVDVRHFDSAIFHYENLAKQQTLLRKPNVRHLEFAKKLQFKRAQYIKRHTNYDLMKGRYEN